MLTKKLSTTDNADTGHVLEVDLKITLEGKKVILNFPFCQEKRPRSEYTNYIKSTKLKHF